MNESARHGTEPEETKMSATNDEIAARVASNPMYHLLVKMRSSYSIVMTLCVMAVYYGYILLIAFDKEWLGAKLGTDMTTSIGIPISGLSISRGPWTMSRPVPPSMTVYS